MNEDKNLGTDSNAEFQPIEEEFYEHFHHIVDKGQESLRIDKYLMLHRQNATRNKISQTARAGNVLVNNQVVKQNYRVKPNDVISVVFAHPPRENKIIAQDLPIDIVYEDHDLIVINKQVGMVVHPGFGNYSGTLVNALAFHFENLPNINSDLDRPGLVHRIDKNTSGLMVIAKNEYAMSHLAKQFFDRTTKRRYWAFVWGNVEADEGRIEGHIGRDLKDRMQMAVFEDASFGKHAVTHYKVIERFKYVTWVECRLETGRTHQIRAHMKHIGHTLFNDERYGGHLVLKGQNLPKYKQFMHNMMQVLPRQALHAQSLGFTHPISKKEMLFESEMPNDMNESLMKWRNYFKKK